MHFLKVFSNSKSHIATKFFILHYNMTDRNLVACLARCVQSSLRFQGRWWPDCPIFARTDLDAGWAHIGPAVIEHELSTILVPPGFEAKITSLGDIMLIKEG